MVKRRGGGGKGGWGGGSEEEEEEGEEEEKRPKCDIGEKDKPEVIEEERHIKLSAHHSERDNFVKTQFAWPFLCLFSRLASALWARIEKNTE